MDLCNTSCAHNDTVPAAVAAVDGHRTDDDQIHLKNMIDIINLVSFISPCNE